VTVPRFLRASLIGILAFIASLGCRFSIPTATPDSTPEPLPSWTPEPTPTPTEVPPTSTPERIVLTDANTFDIQPVDTLAGHQNIVRAIAFSPDGSRLAVGTGGNSSQFVYRVSLWDPRDGTLMARSEELNAITWDVAFSPDGKWVAAALDTGIVRIWTSDTLGHVTDLAHAGAVNSLAFSPDGRLLAAGVAESGNGVVVVWDLEQQTVLRRFWAHPYSVPAMDFSPTGQFLATGAVDRSVKLWQVSNAELIVTLPQDGQGTGIQFSPGGELLASSMCALSNASLECLRGEVWLWSTQNWSRLRVLDGPTDWVEAIAFAPKADLLAGAGRDFGVYLWRVSDGKLLRTLVGHDQMVSDADFAPDGDILASGSSDETVILWGIRP
jgi:WD40 repeat protein